MLTADVRFEGWTEEAWRRFLSLWKPGAEGARSGAVREPTSRGGLFVVHDGAHVRKLLHTMNGRQPPATAWPVPLDVLAESNDASWAVAGHLGALDEVMERFGARARREDDLTDQALSLIGIVREMTSEGTLARWPRRLHGIPTPTAGMVQHA